MYMCLCGGRWWDAVERCAREDKIVGRMLNDWVQVPGRVKSLPLSWRAMTGLAVDDECLLLGEAFTSNDAKMKGVPGRGLRLGCGVEMVDASEERGPETVSDWSEEATHSSHLAGGHIPAWTNTSLPLSS